MKVCNWLEKNTASLSGKTVAITGSTGGIGRELCGYLAELGADLVLIDRNAERSRALARRLEERRGGISVRCITADLEDILQVKAARDELLKMEIDAFVHNAGAYAIERHRCSTGYDNVFQINFVSPYFLIRELLPSLEKRGGKAVVVSSIAHRYSKTDPSDVDFLSRTRASLAYGNAKRYLTYSLYGLSEEKGASIAVTHPGITFTNITSHYPPAIFAIIKYPMKLIFMKPKKAALCVLRGLFEDCGECEWIGPRFFDVWGLPRKKKLRSADARERAEICREAERIYRELGL